MALTKFILNGSEQTIEGLEPEIPLLWVLRDSLGMVGTKYGCGIAHCGACTVHLNGRPVRACSIPISSVKGQSVTTIEGLAQTDGLHPLQQAWIDLDVPQCGYCQGWSNYVSGRFVTHQSQAHRRRNRQSHDR